MKYFESRKQYVLKYLAARDLLYASLNKTFCYFLTEVEEKLNKWFVRFLYQLQDLECELDDKQMQIYELEDLVRQLESAKDEQKNTSMTESFDQPRHGEQPSFNDEISKLSEENVRFLCFIMWW